MFPLLCNTYYLFTNNLFCPVNLLYYNINCEIYQSVYTYRNEMLLKKLIIKLTKNIMLCIITTQNKSILKINSS